MAVHYRLAVTPPRGAFSSWVHGHEAYAVCAAAAAAAAWLLLAHTDGHVSACCPVKMFFFFLMRSSHAITRLPAKNRPQAR